MAGFRVKGCGCADTNPPALRAVPAAGLLGANYADSWVDVKGTGWTIIGNVGFNTNNDGFQTHQRPGQPQSGASGAAVEGRGRPGRRGEVQHGHAERRQWL